ACSAKNAPSHLVGSPACARTLRSFSWLLGRCTAPAGRCSAQWKRWRAKSRSRSPRPAWSPPLICQNSASPVFPHQHHLAEASRLAMAVVSSRLLRGHVKRQRLAEPVRLPDSKRNARKHPYPTDNLCGPAQVQPQPQANKEPDDRWNKVPHFFFLAPHKVT